MAWEKIMTNLPIFPAALTCDGRRASVPRATKIMRAARCLGIGAIVPVTPPVPYWYRTADDVLAIVLISAVVEQLRRLAPRRSLLFPWCLFPRGDPRQGSVASNNLVEDITWLTNADVCFADVDRWWATIAVGRWDSNYCPITRGL